MFEKEAEEYEDNAEYIEIDDYGHKVYGWYEIEQAYQKGAEYGYNKANEKAKEIIREFMRISTVCDEDFEPDYSVLIDEAEKFLREEE